MISMSKELDNILDCRQHLRDKLPAIIEYFVEYYGEEHREIITKKLSEPLYLAYRRPEALQRILHTITQEISNEIIEKQIKRVKTKLTAEDLLDGMTFSEGGNATPLKKYHDFYELFKLGPEGREKQFLDNSYASILGMLPGMTREEFDELVRTQTLPEKYNRIHPWIKNNVMYYIDPENAENQYQRAFRMAEDLIHKIDENITADNYAYYIDQEEIQKLNKLADAFPKMEREFLDRMEKYKEYREEQQLHENMKDNLQTKYQIQFMRENLDLLSPEDIEKWKEYEKDPSKSYKLTDYTRYIFGYWLGSNHPLDAFGDEANQYLSDNKDQWRIERIKKERIEFFQKHGIDLGNDYQKYVESKEAQKIWPSIERVRQFQESRDRLLNDYNIEYFENIPSHRAGRQEIENYHFLDKVDSFNASLYTKEKGYTFVNPNIVKTEDGYHLVPIVCVRCDGLTGDLDHTIIHELNHIIELALMEADEDHYNFICGWDPFKEDLKKEPGKIDTLHEDDTKREYELFNEIINELIAQEISEKMQRDGFYIFDSPDNSNYKFTTSYIHTFVLVRNFFDEFKKEIIESRHNGNIQIIWDTVGKENFDALNKLFHEFYENFSGFKIYSVLSSLQKNEETEQTRRYKDLFRRSQEILKKMRLYSMQEKPQEVEKKDPEKK